VSSASTETYAQRQENNQHPKCSPRDSHGPDETLCAGSPHTTLPDDPHSRRAVWGTQLAVDGQDDPGVDAAETIASIGSGIESETSPAALTCAVIMPWHDTWAALPTARPSGSGAPSNEQG